MISTDVSASLATFLKQISAQDPEFVKELVNRRFLVNNEALDVVCPSSLDPLQAGFLGVINGFLDSIDQPRISFMEEADGSITSFDPIVPAWKTIQVDGIEVEVDGRLPEDETARIREYLGGRLTPLLVNYRARISKLPDGVNILLICAPDAPMEELHALRSHFDQALEDPDYHVSTNYEVTITGRGDTEK